MNNGNMAKNNTSRASRTTLKRNNLRVECFFANNGRLERKIERYDQQFTEYAYQYDVKGHLTKVRRDGTVVEHYQYNQRGQRIEQQREYQGFSDSIGGMQRYDEAGRLVRAGDTSFYYDTRGSLSERCDCQGISKYFYDKDTMLDKVILPSRAEIRYEYDKSNPTAPARRFRSGTLTAEFAWTNRVQLAAYRDHDNLLEYTFTYDASGILHKVRIAAFTLVLQKAALGTDWAEASTDWLGSMVANNRRERLHDFLGKRSLPFEFLCGCDQVGTVKILKDKSGRLVKEVLRDSFGVQCGDSFPDLFMPIGFAGGLTDQDTGLVRFGYRNYDPSVGRFTALDPAKDRRGDGDLYDYCVDDPVNAIDPTGLMGCRPQFCVDEDQHTQPPPAQAQEQAAAQAQGVPQQQQPATAASQAQAPVPAAARQPAQVAQAGQPQANANAPRGIRNNNPGNLRPLTRDQWQGQTGTEANFSVFDTPENGLRGMAVLLTTYHQTHGVRTVSGIIERYASPEENDTRAYITHVSRALGVTPDQEIDLRNRDVFSTLMNTMIRHENGQNPYGCVMDQINAMLASSPAAAEEGREAEE